MSKGYYYDPGCAECAQKRREEIRDRLQSLAEMRAEGHSELVIYAMTRFWAKWDEVRGFRRPKSSA